MIFVGVVTDDGKKLLLDYPQDFKTHYAQFAGDEVEVEVRKHRAKRSLKQNRWMHSFLRPLADHLGYTVEELKLVGMVAVFGTHAVMGQTVPVKAHTSQLTTQEMVDLCEWFVQVAAEHDLVILYPDEFKRARAKAAKHAA